MLEFPTFEDQPALVDRWLALRDPWAGMEWMYHDPICEEYWPRLSGDFSEFQFLVYDEDAEAVIGESRTVPFRWTGQEEELPDGIDGVLPLACDGGEEPNTLCAILAVVAPDARAKGVSAEILKHMAAVAREHGLSRLVAPVRPTHKARYPVTPIEHYANWRRSDGLLFDTWLRTHERLGARMAGICHNSNTYKGTVAQWTDWTTLEFMETGAYLAPGMMNSFQIDLATDEGTYTEPNVWMVHEAVRSRLEPRG
jgi:GNAT superfamily N-acetyltransferase